MTVIDVLEKQRKAKILLGEDTYKRIFHEVKAMDDRRQQELSDKVVTTIINGEVLGRPLKPGEGTPTISPELYTHPVAHMKRQGNKTKWLTCAQCKNRWEGHTLGDVTPEGIPTG